MKEIHNHRNTAQYTTWWKTRYAIAGCMMALAYLSSCDRTSLTRLSTGSLEVGIDGEGYVRSFTDKDTNVEYMPASERGPLVAVVDDGRLAMPVSFDAVNDTTYRLGFDQSPVQVELRIVAKPTHIAFRVTDITGDEELEALLWGPYPTTIGETIGENIGVVRNGTYAIGIQSLNPKTTAGRLDNIQGITTYHGNAADSAAYGSVLQAFAIDRTRDRTESKWDGWENRYPGRPMDVLHEEEGSIVGTAIALFGCVPEEALQTIGAIEVAEGLPHPEIDGVWVKESPESNRAYAISPFTEEDVDVMIDYTVRAGLRSLYHEGPFSTWGHFELDEAFFPDGRAGLKACVEKAKAAGLNMGVHTLTNFITTNDRFVTPVPDHRLVITGSAVLTEDIGSENTDIGISDNQMILNQKKSHLNTVRIGDELVRYGSVSEEPPYVLRDCVRGAFGTSAMAHAQGDTAVKLLDFAYRTLYPNWDMQKDVVANLTEFLNETGVNHIDFDGHEGCYATGQGDYAMDEFAWETYLQSDHTLINGSSRLKHFYWHINHYINWGEPWYGGFRESQADRRFKVQPFLERNLLQNMLGWFMITRATLPADIEWMMARAAGYDAGFAMVLRRPELENNPYKNELLDLISTWEEARLTGVFSQEQRERLKDGNNEFRLEKKDDNTWILHPFVSSKFEHTKKVLQPGEPTASEWTFRNEGEAQPLQFKITVIGKDGSIRNPELEFDNSFAFNLPTVVEAGASIACDGSPILRIYDAKGRFVEAFDMGREPPVLREGNHQIRFDCDFPNNEDLVVRIIVKQTGMEEEIKL